MNSLCTEENKNLAIALSRLNGNPLSLYLLGIVDAQNAVKQWNRANTGRTKTKQELQAKIDKIIETELKK